MPKLPRDCDADGSIALFKKYSYEVPRKSGSHIRLYSEKLKHSITIPDHKAIKVGTLNNILNELAKYGEIDKQQLIVEL